MIHADPALARRLEALICNEWRQFAALGASVWPEKGVDHMEAGGGSQRNMERLGFRVIYPHLQFAKV